MTIVAPATFGAMGFDTIAKISFEQAARMAASGMKFAVRYLGPLDAAEVQGITDGGLALMPVTYSRAEGWPGAYPSAALGAQDGAQDVEHLRAAGIPVGATVWIDLEGCPGDAASTAAWCNARAIPILSAGYLAGLYVGAGQALSGHQLYALKEARYWHSCSRGVPEPDCGYVMRQLYKPNQVIAGVEVDLDVIQHDFLGRLPTWVTRG